MKCVACGLEGKYFFLERHSTEKSAHFNLYGLQDGNYVLMTKDHILAKSNGGANHVRNYQTMCSICNNLKGDHDLPLENIAELRMLYNQNLTLPRKVVSKMINEARLKMVAACSNLPAQSDTAPKWQDSKPPATGG
jgi:hypothetical protein